MLKLVMVILMANLEFKTLQCSVNVTCFSEDGEISDLDAIKNEIKENTESVLSDIIVDRNNVLAIELSDVVELSDGSGNKS